MQEIIGVLETLSRLPGTHVDCNYRHSRECVSNHLLAWLDDGTEYHPEVYDFNRDEAVDGFIRSSQEDVKQLTKAILPYHLPDDYLFFLEYCGGLSILAERLVNNMVVETMIFELSGLGPQTHEWYGDICYINSISENDPQGVHEFLYIGDIDFDLLTRPLEKGIDWSAIVKSDRRRMASIDIDLAGSVQKYAIIIEHRDEDDSLLSWMKVADSFTELLRKVVEMWK